MNKYEFKERWESNDSGGGITYDDIADCYIKWGLGQHPKTRPMDTVRYLVLKSANTCDAEDFNPKTVEYPNKLG